MTLDTFLAVVNDSMKLILRAFATLTLEDAVICSPAGS